MRTAFDEFPPKEPIHLVLYEAAAEIERLRDPWVSANVDSPENVGLYVLGVNADTGELEDPAHPDDIDDCGGAFFSTHITHWRYLDLPTPPGESE